MSDEIKLTLEPFEDENKHELDSAVQAAVQATEALEQAEAKVEKEVQQAIEALLGKCTVILVAHRLNTLSRVDAISESLKAKSPVHGSSINVFKPEARSHSFRYSAFAGAARSVYRYSEHIAPPDKLFICFCFL